MTHDKKRGGDTGMKWVIAKVLPAIIIGFMFAFAGDVRSGLLGNERARVNIEDTAAMAVEVDDLDDRLYEVEREFILYERYKTMVESHSEQIVRMRETDVELSANLAEITRNLNRVMDRLDRMENR